MIAVSLISALRLLGIFLILPVFSVYAVHYPGASAALAGVAFGAYALIQSLMQLPLGWASDRWGRRPVLLSGLAVFALGSVACALAEDIIQLIIARTIQGAGAVGSVAFAALADVTRPSVRSQAYTITGIAIGSAFMIGILAGPILAAHIGLNGLFYLLAGLALLALLIAAASFPDNRGSADNQAPMAASATASRPCAATDFSCGIRSFTGSESIFFHLSFELERSRPGQDGALESLPDYFFTQCFFGFSVCSLGGKTRPVPRASPARLG